MSGSFDDLTVMGAWFGILMFSIQIYFDFSGYSDMAIGLGKIFGFTYKENFNHPYIARSATEFWRRWHISLGSFFRDYVYIPMGGNRKHYLRNLFTVWFLTGLWHGASWNFILWGLYFGLLIFMERLFLSKLFDLLPKIFSALYFYVMVLVGWVIFYFTDLSLVTSYLKIMFGLSGKALIDLPTQLIMESNMYFTVLALVLCTPLLERIYKRTKDTIDKLTVSGAHGLMTPIINIALLLIVTTLLVGDTYNPFLYFRF
jgi:alginate O-acetyltransferase complex protein AlgI